MDSINFSHPWCGNSDHFKIHHQRFTTIRKHNPKKYVKGRSIGICYREKPVKICTIKNVDTCTLQSISGRTFISDTGYNKTESLKIFSKMYNMSEAALCSIMFDVIYLETDCMLISESAKSVQLCLKFS